MPRGVGVRVPLSAQKRSITGRFFASKGPRTSGSASGDLSSVGGDALRCNATMVMG